MPKLDHEGISLFYKEAGQGELTLVLVHGWGCDHRFMTTLFDYFSASYRVVAVDLRGHGLSDKPRTPYTISTFTEDLVWMCCELELDQVVLIGHSMGGGISLESAATRPEWLAGAVLLDSAVLPSPDVWAGVQPVIEGLHTSGYREVLRKFFKRAFFLNTNDNRDADWIIETMLETPQHVLASSFERIFDLDSSAAASMCTVPTLYIASTHPRGDLARFAQLCPQLVHGQVVSSGHFIQIEVPDQVNAMIKRFLELHVQGF